MLARCLLLVSLFLSLSLSAVALEVGDEAPDFSLVGSDGKTYKLDDFRDKQAVVIAWFPRAFTGGCTKECKSFRDDGPKMAAFKVMYFTASTDTAEKNAEFAKSLGLDYPILSDPTGEIATKFGVYNAEKKAAARVTFIIGIDGKILAIDRGVKTDTHGADIAEKLASLGVKRKE